MERRLSQGDYVPDGGGGLTALGDGEEVLARVLFRLTAHRGAMPFLPELGSRLYLLGREKPSARQAWPPSMWPRPCGRRRICRYGQWSWSRGERRPGSLSIWTGGARR